MVEPVDDVRAFFGDSLEKMPANLTPQDPITISKTMVDIGTELGATPANGLVVRLVLGNLPDLDVTELSIMFLERTTQETVTF